MSELLTHLSKVIPALLVISAVFGFIGWSIRGLSAKPETKASKPNPSADKGSQERAKNLESALEKSKAAHKLLKAELDSLRVGSVSKDELNAKAAELEAAHVSLASESKRTAALEVELRKNQEALKHLNARSNDASKAQKDRSFAMENELSKARQELAVLHARPDDTTALHAEIERLKESVATTTRYAGELRKRESAALEALEKARGQTAAQVPESRALGPISRPTGDSDRVAAAKAEVIRLTQKNQQEPADVPATVVAATTATAVAAEVPTVIPEPPIETAPPLELPAYEEELQTVQAGTKETAE